MRDRERNAAMLGAAGLRPDEVLSLQSISRKLHAADERQCNGYADSRGNWDEGSGKRDEARVERLERDAKEIAEAHGWAAYHQSDPRGWSLYMVRPQDLTIDGVSYKIDSVYSRGIAVCSR